MKRLKTLRQRLTRAEWRKRANKIRTRARIAREREQDRIWQQQLAAQCAASEQRRRHASDDALEVLAHALLFGGPDANPFEIPIGLTFKDEK